MGNGSGSGCLLIVVAVALVAAIVIGAWVAENNPRCFLANDPITCVEASR